jgi:predicted NAD/FAD-binding protein
MKRVPEVKNLVRLVMEEPERMFELLHIDTKRQAERAVTELMKAELTQFLGRAQYGRAPVDTNVRDITMPAWTAKI